MKPVGLKFFVFFLGIAVWIGWQVFQQIQEQTGGKREKKGEVVPVAVEDIRRGEIELRRRFNGTLEAQSELIVASKVSGRVERLYVNLADSVQRDQQVAQLDSGEYVQALAQAQAEREVARAEVGAAQTALNIADREWQRIQKLRGQGVSSEAQLDTALANQQAKQAQLKVTQAQEMRAEALLKTAQIRLSYTQVKASWSGGRAERVVAQRLVHEGEMVAAQAPLLKIIDLTSLMGVIFVPEQDYLVLTPDLPVLLTTDLYPNATFAGHIERISPIFQNNIRQARIEINVENPEKRLKPGLFIQATVVLQHLSEATLVPEHALTQREGKTGLFIIKNEQNKPPVAVWHEVQVGIRQGEWVQIVQEEPLAGEVVVLGQNLLKDGSMVTIPSQEGASSPLSSDKKGQQP
ncbi:MAG: efflux RND transporter periplasmic adaptor subunit [Magnetococcus sp. DMHC-6]